MEEQKRKNWGLLCQNHHCQLGKGFCFSKFYCRCRFSHLKTYLSEDKLARQFNLPDLFTKLGKIVDLQTVPKSVKVSEKARQPDWFSFLGFTWVNLEMTIYSFLEHPHLWTLGGLSDGCPVLMLQLTLICLANNYLEYSEWWHSHKLSQNMTSSLNSFLD